LSKFAVVRAVFLQKMSAANYRRASVKGRPVGSFTAKRAGKASSRAASSRAAAMATNRASYPRTVYRNPTPGVVKGMDTQLGPFAPLLTTSNTNAGVYILNLVQQGAGSWNRVGKRIKMKSLRVKILCEALFDNNGGADPTRGAVMRFVVVYDKQSTGAAQPTFDTIFGETAQNGTESSNVMANLRFDNTDRFKVIRDMVVTLCPNAIPGAAEQGVVHKAFIDEYIDLKDLTTVFGGQTAPMTIADISSGALYLYLRADPTSAPNTACATTGESVARLRYTDA